MRKLSQIVWKSIGTACMPAAKPMLETLEGRCLMSVASLSPVIHPVPGPGHTVPAVVDMGFTVTAVAGEKFTGVIGEIKNLGDTAAGAKELANLSSLQIRFSWGDTKAFYIGSGGLSVDSSGDLIITESHTFAKSGTYAINIAVETNPAVVPPPGATPRPVVIGTIRSTAEVLPMWHFPMPVFNAGKL